MKNKDWKIDPISLFSHELKTPLSSLKLGLSLLEKDFEKHKDILFLMKEEVEKMIDFIMDNLDLRYIQEKKDLFQWEWKNFEPILSQACSSLKLIAQNENITFHTKNLKGNGSIELFMDSSWIRCLLKNLLSNAVQFSPKNSQIFIEYGCNNNKNFTCSIKDKGTGLSDDENIFDPFYKSSWPSKNLKNTGLGLSIAKAIVEAHGGRIKAFSSPQAHQGTTFQFTLPQARFIKQSA